MRRYYSQIYGRRHGLGASKPPSTSTSTDLTKEQARVFETWNSALSNGTVPDVNTINARLGQLRTRYQTFMGSPTLSNTITIQSALNEAIDDFERALKVALTGHRALSNALVQVAPDGPHDPYIKPDQQIDDIYQISKPLRGTGVQVHEQVISGPELMAMLTERYANIINTLQSALRELKSMSSVMDPAAGAARMAQEANTKLSNVPTIPQILSSVSSMGAQVNSAIQATDLTSLSSLRADIIALRGDYSSSNITLTATLQRFDTYMNENGRDLPQVILSMLGNVKTQLEDRIGALRGAINNLNGMLSGMGQATTDYRSQMEQYLATSQPPEDILADMTAAADAAYDGGPGPWAQFVTGLQSDIQNWQNYLTGLVSRKASIHQAAGTASGTEATMLSTLESRYAGYISGYEALISAAQRFVSQAPPPEPSTANGNGNGNGNVVVPPSNGNGNGTWATAPVEGESNIGLYAGIGAAVLLAAGGIGFALYQKGKGGQ